MNKEFYYIMRERETDEAVGREYVGQLILCRDCKHCEPCRDSDESKDAVTGFYCKELHIEVFDDFYCGYGERRQDG